VDRKIKETEKLRGGIVKQITSTNILHIPKLIIKKEFKK
jgi:hypothetical protein